MARTRDVRRIRGGLTVALLAALLSGCTETATSPPSVATTGEAFAIWPEDDEADAAAACLDRDEEPWRTSREATAERFAEDVLGWSETSLPWRATDESPSLVRVLDSSMSGSSSGIILTLARFEECWFVRDVRPKADKDLLDMTTGFTEVDGETNLLVRYGGPGKVVADYGFGGAQRSRIRAGEQLLIPVEDEGSAGHVFLIGQEQPSSAVQGVPLPVPLDPLRKAPAPKKDGYAMWPFNFHGWYGDGPCYRKDRRTPYLHDPKSSLRRFVREELGAASPSLVRRDELHWTVRSERAHVDVTLRRVFDDCWPIKEVVNRGRRIDLTVWIDEGFLTVDLEWGEAAYAVVDVNYGPTRTETTIGRIEGPFTTVASPPFELATTSGVSFDLTRKGAAYVALFDSAGRLIGVEGSALGKTQPLPD